MTGTILSKHYDTKHPATYEPIKREDIKSGPAKRNSVTSHGHGDEYSYGIKGGNLVFNTSNRSELFPISQERIVNGRLEYGLPTSWEESGPRFHGWLSNATDNNPSLPSNREISSVPMPRVAYIEGITPLRMHFPNKYDTPVADYTTPTIAHVGPINDTGKEVYATHLRKQDVRSFLFDDKGIREETSAWLPFLESVGRPIKRENPVYAIGVEHDVGGLGYVAAYYPNPEKRYVVFEHKFDQAVRKLASELGINTKEGIDAIKRSDISHEILRHGMAGIGGERIDEKEQGSIGYEFHSDRANSYNGTYAGRINRAIAEAERLYAKEFSLWRHIKDEITQDINPPKKGPKRRLAETFLKHGIAIGKKGADLDKYVQERLEETYGALEDEPSYRRSESSVKNVYSEGIGGLERAVISGENVSFDLRGSKLAATIDGAVAGDDGANMPTHFIGTYINGNEGTYEGKGHRSMDDVKTNLKKGEKARQPEKPNADAPEEAPVEASA